MFQFRDLMGIRVATLIGRRLRMPGRSTFQNILYLVVCLIAPNAVHVSDADLAVRDARSMSRG